MTERSKLRVVNGGIDDVIAMMYAPRKNQGWERFDESHPPLGRTMCSGCQKWRKHASFHAQIPDTLGGHKGSRATRVCDDCVRERKRARATAGLRTPRNEVVS